MGQIFHALGDRRALIIPGHACFPAELRRLICDLPCTRAARSWDGGVLGDNHRHSRTRCESTIIARQDGAGRGLSRRASRRQPPAAVSGRQTCRTLYPWPPRFHHVWQAKRLEEKNANDWWRVSNVPTGEYHHHFLRPRSLWRDRHAYQARWPAPCQVKSTLHFIFSSVGRQHHFPASHVAGTYLCHRSTVIPSSPLPPPARAYLHVA